MLPDWFLFIAQIFSIPFDAECVGLPVNNIICKKLANYKKIRIGKSLFNNIMSQDKPYNMAVTIDTITLVGIRNCTSLGHHSCAKSLK